jgi:phosphotransferase system enzyme I (PtsI)
MARIGKQQRRWRGIAAAPGIALGPAFVYRVSRDEPPLRRLKSTDDVEGELQQLDESLQAVRQELQDLKADSGTTVGSALSKIFDAQVMIVDDPTIIGDVKAMIEKEQIGAESAFSRVVGAAQQTVARAPDPYLREMSNDIAAVKKRVINHLLGISETINKPLSRPVVVLAANITPSDIVSLKREHILGIVTESGGQTSHTAVLAKSLNIPAVVGVNFDVRDIRPGSLVAVDGYDGVIVLEPERNTVEFIERKKRRTRSPWPKKYDNIRDLPAETTDGHTVGLMANIDLAGEAPVVVQVGADGVGLYRTEYLYLAKGDYPSERAQFDVYRQAVEALQGRPLIVRTFDLGSDKAAPDAPREPNPALGLRGIRLSLKYPRGLDTQLRALVAASAHGPIWIMIPMVSDLEEVRRVRRHLTDAREKITRRGVLDCRETPLGIMVETPAAVSLVDDLVREVDFLSIGTNDLLQYTLATDRGNQTVSRPENAWHPALWRQIATVAQAGKKAKRPAGLCGELASDPVAVPLLIGLGLSSLSAHPNTIPKIKSVVRSLDYKKAQEAAQHILTLSHASEIRHAAKAFAAAL